MLDELVGIVPALVLVVVSLLFVHSLLDLAMKVLITYILIALMLGFTKMRKSRRDRLLRSQEDKQ